VSDKLERLEQLRGAAAFYVFIHHYVRHNLPEAPGVARFFVFGQAAVLLFFLLSGFVIHVSALRRGGLSALDYFLRRFRRIYPVFAIALALSYLAACLDAGAFVGPQPRELGLNLLQLHGLDRAPGQWADCYMGNEPLWSLAYEWWFYVLFFVVYVRTASAHGRWRWAAAISIVGLGVDLLVPNPLSLMASYFVLWWLGAQMAHEWFGTGRVSLRGQLPALGGAAAVTLGWVVAAAFEAKRVGAFDAYHHPGITARHFLTTLAIVAALGAWARLGAKGKVLLRPFGRIAPFSYALYVFHLPLIFMAKHVSTGWGALDFLWITPMLFGLCWLAEQPLQRRVNALLSLRAKTP